MTPGQGGRGSPLLSQPCFLCAAPSQIQARLRPGHLYKDIPQAFQAHTVTPNPTSSPESVSRFPRPSCLPRYPQHKHWIGLHLPTSPTCLLVLFPRNVSKIPPHFCYLHSCDVVLNLLSPRPWTVPLVVQPLPAHPTGSSQNTPTHLMPCKPLTRACQGLASPSKACPILASDVPAALASPLALQQANAFLIFRPLLWPSLPLARLWLPVPSGLRRASPEFS